MYDDARCSKTKFNDGYKCYERNIKVKNSNEVGISEINWTSGVIMITISNALVRVTNLRLRAYIGIKPDEQTNLQDIIINIRLSYLADEAVSQDRIEKALNYRSITKAVINFVDGRRFQLLEKLTDEVLKLVMTDSRVHDAEVRIEKPHALRYADSVSVTLSGHRVNV